MERRVLRSSVRSTVVLLTVSLVALGVSAAAAAAGERAGWWVTIIGRWQCGAVRHLRHVGRRPGRPPQPLPRGGGPGPFRHLTLARRWHCHRAPTGLLGWSRFAALMLLLAGCGGGERTTREAVAAPTYVREVCEVMVRWNDDVAAAFRADEARPDSNRPASIRKDVVDFLDAVQASTDAMRARVAAAGTPDVPNGTAVARDLQAVLEAASAKLKTNRDDFAAIPLSDVQPAASIEGTMTVLAAQFEAVQAAVQRLGEQSPPVREARERDAACKKFREQSG